MSTLDFGEKAAKGIERVYKTPDVVTQRMGVLQALALTPGERVLDIGVGPGLLAYDMAATVGDTGFVAGIDLSEPMLAMSRERCDEFTHVEFQHADATKLPYDDGEFNAIVCTQVYEYVADMDTALTEAYRVLGVDGRIVILDTAWDSLVVNTSNRSLNERVLKTWEEHLVHPNLPAQLGAMLTRNGFQTVQNEIIPMFSPTYNDNSYAAGILISTREFAKGRGGLTEADVEDWHADLLAKANSGEFFFSLNRYLFSAIKKTPNKF